MQAVILSPVTAAAAAPAGRDWGQGAAHQNALVLLLELPTPIEQFCTYCRQWSFPLPLPLPLLGVFGAKELPANGGDLPWSDELEHACLAEYIGAAPYSEVAAFPTAVCRNMHRSAIVEKVTSELGSLSLGYHTCGRPRSNVGMA